MKSLGKSIVVAISWALVSRLRRVHDIKIVAVTGSIGKTGTKRAIASVLSEKYKVRWQDGNYNDIYSVPLIFFGLAIPSLTNPLAWLKVFRQMKSSIKDYPYSVVVLELGTDAPGQISMFSKYLEVDIGVVTPIAPEHMEYFGSIQQVAKEELSLGSFSKNLVISEENTSYKTLFDVNYTTYGQKLTSDACVEFGSERTSYITENNNYQALTKLVGAHQLTNLAAAVSVAEQMGLDKSQIEKGLSKIDAMPGRMQLLKGINSSVIIDDTYNSSPEAVRAALDTLYGYARTHKIAVLGNMNEMGELSAELHKQMGEYCDPKKVDLVITIGPDANKHLAEAAKSRGCQVLTSDSSYKIGEILKGELNSKSVVLLKGSQNGVFLEEAIKPILANPGDQAKLVRKSKDWLSKKQKLLEQ